MSGFGLRTIKCTRITKTQFHCSVMLPNQGLTPYLRAHEKMDDKLGTALFIGFGRILWRQVSLFHAEI